MPTIEESSLSINTPTIDPVSVERPIAIGPISMPILRSTLHSSEVLDTVTQETNATSGALPVWKVTPIGAPIKPISATPGSLPPASPLIVPNSFSANSVGYVFDFYLQKGVAGYNVYRSTSSSFSSASLIQYISQPFTNADTLAFSDPMTHGSATYYYWMTTVTSEGLESVPSEVGSATGSVVTTYTPGIPQQVTGIIAAESPYKTPDGKVLSLVEVSFTPAVGDPYFQGVDIYFNGYNGSFIPQLMTSATQSPASFLCETTHETVEVIVVAVGTEGYNAPFSGAPTTYVTLNGSYTAPAPPSIAQAQTALDGNIGWQFAFNIIGGLEFDQIQSYRIYHSELNVAPSDYFRTIPQPHSNSGQEIVQEVTGDILFYWVSAVNVVGLESVLVSVPFTYIDPGAPPPNLNPIVTTPKSSSPATILNGFAPSAHELYWEPTDGTYVFGYSSTETANPFTNPGYAYDGSQSTAASYSDTHNASYGACVWSFASFPALPSGVTVTAATLSVVSETLPTAGPVHGQSSIWYSLDGGSTWTALYTNISASRTKQTDSLVLSTSQNFANIQVMACAHAHDDLAMNVYEISLSITQSANPNPQQVTGVVATLVGGDVQISWNGLAPLTRTDISGYEVYRALHGAGYIASHLQTTVASTGAATYSWIDVAAHDGSWDYWVIGVSSTGWSPASSPPAFLQNSANVLYLSGVTLESLKPAQLGADVTAQNTDILLQNPNFLAGNTGWAPQLGWSIASGAGFNGSGFYAQYTGLSTAAITNNQKIPCAAGAVIAATAMVEGSATATGNAVVRINYYNSSGSVISQTNGSSATANIGWNQSRCVVTAPAGTAYCQIDFAVYSETAGFWLVGGFTASIHANSIDEVPDGSTYAKTNAISLKSGFAATRVSRGSILSLNPTHYWALDGASLSDAGTSPSALSVYGTVTESNVTLAPGDANYGATLNNASALYTATATGFTTWSVCMWLQPYGTSFSSPSGILGRANTVPPTGATNYETILSVDASNYIYAGAYTGAASVLRSSKPLNFAIAHHIAVTLSSNTLSLYIDGVLDGTLTGLSTESPGTENYWVLNATNGNWGAPGLGAGWNIANPGGHYQDVAIWEGTALGPGDISAIYGSGSGAVHSLDAIQDSPNYLRLPSTVYGPSGRAILPNGNLLLKNKDVIPGVTTSPTVSTAGFADLPELGSGNAAMTFTTQGNPCFISINVGFYAATSGGSSGPITGIGVSFNSTVTGASPPGIGITISGTGTGASASVAWTSTGAYPNFTWTPHLSITGGSGYSSATATVTITGGYGAYPNGTNTYSCSIDISTPQANVPVQIRVLMDGNPVYGPVQILSDYVGNSVLTGTQMLFPTAGSHTFQVQAYNMNSSDVVQSTTRSFQLIELG